MTIAIRITLIIASVLLVTFVVINIRKSKMRIEDAIFWFAISLIILILSLVPQIAFWISDLLGFLAPINFVFLVFIAILLVKCFSLSQHVSLLEAKLNAVAQCVAIDESNDMTPPKASPEPEETREAALN